MKERTIIVLLENIDLISKNETYKDTSIEKYEFHIIKVQNEVVWRKFQSFSGIENITSFNYNHILNVGVLIEYRRNESEIGPYIE